MFQPSEIKSFYSDWRSLYRENDDRGDICKSFAIGDQWDSAIVQDRSLRGEDSLTFNILQKQLLRVKGESEKVELSLNIKGNFDPNLMREGIHVLNHFILHNNNLSAFSSVLKNVYDYGYGALLVSTKQCQPNNPSEEPYLVPITDPRKVFFDVRAQDPFKTEGRFCGVCYDIPIKQLTASDRRLAGDRDRKIAEIIDFWYREPYEETYWFTPEGQWTTAEPTSFVIKKKVQNYRVKFMRLIDGKIKENPIEWWTQTKLPLVYWKGNEGTVRVGSQNITATTPFVFNLIDAQKLTNYTGSAIVGRLKKLGGTKVVVTDQMIDGKENFWEDFNSRAGVIQINESEDGSAQAPTILKPDTLDSALLNAMQLCIQLLDNLSGVNSAQQGAQTQVTTNAGLHRQIMQGNILQNVILSNHLSSINEVGRILKEMVPKIVVEERDIGRGIVVNSNGKLHTPSAPEIRNDIKTLFSKTDFVIEYGASSDAEKSANLIAIKEIIQTNPQIAPYLADEFAANLNTANSDNLKRRLEALMPPGIKDVGEGFISVEEYQKKIKEEQEQQQQQQQQQAQQQQQQPDGKLELEKQKLSMQAQFKQQEIDIKKAKLQNYIAKDSKNLKIKEVNAISKMMPKTEVIDANRQD